MLNRPITIFGANRIRTDDENKDVVAFDLFVDIGDPLGVLENECHESIRGTYGWAGIPVTPDISVIIL
jgi:hypothetical protein